MSLAETKGRTNGVGVPLAELTLTRALEDHAHSVSPPGTGRSLVHLREVELGTGRPDSILVVLSSSGLKARMRADLRLATLAQARVLESIRNGIPSGYSPSYVNHLKNLLRDSGWLTKDLQAINVPNLIYRSLTIEAKISNWYKGICQLARARWASHSSALLIPTSTQGRVSRKALSHNRLGLLVENNGTIKWRIKSPSQGLRWMADLWLTELTIRGIESNTVKDSPQF